MSVSKNLEGRFGCGAVDFSAYSAFVANVVCAASVMFAASGGALAQDPFSSFTGDVSATESLSFGSSTTVEFDPVYAVNGEVKIDKIDWTVPAVGFPMVFSRHYKSMIAYAGPMGHKWDFPLNARLARDGANVLSYDGTGRVDQFSWDAINSKWVPPTGIYDTLSYNSTTVKYTRATKFGIKYVYDAYVDGGGTPTKARLSSIEDRNGNVLTVTFVASVASNPDAKISYVTDTQGRQYPFTYDANHRLETIADYATTPRKVKYEYDAYGDLTKVTELPGESIARFTTYVYNSASESDVAKRHWLLTITDPKENAKSVPSPFLRNYYDTNGVCIAQEYGGGAATWESSPTSAFTLAMTSAPKTTTVSDRTASTIKYYFDAANLITKKEFLEGGNPYWLYAYDANNNRITTTKPGGAKEICAYDNHGNLLTSKSTDSSGGQALTYTYEYDVGAFHVLTRQTDPQGVVQTFSYDGNGNLLTHVNASGGANLTTTYTYLSGSRYLLNEVTDPRGKVTDYDYDANYRLYTVERDATGAATVVARFIYDEYGNVVTSQDANQRATVYGFNRLNQLTKRTASAPFSYEEKYYYDATDNLTRSEVQNGASAWFVTDYTYDILDNLLTKVEDVTASTTRTTAYAYDAEDRLTLVTTPNGSKVLTVYNEFGLRSETTVGYTTAAAATTVYSYDFDLRLTKVRQPASANHNSVYHYDHHDRITKCEDALGHYQTTSYGADELKDAETWCASGGAELAKTTFAYDQASRLTKTERKIYTSGGTAIGDGWITSTLSYDAAGNLTAAADENGNTTSRTYDGLNRLITEVDPVGSVVTFTYDDVGNVVTKKEEEKREGVVGFDTYVWRFEYDNLHRLTKSYDPAGATSLVAYDQRSNIISTEDPRGAKCYFEYDELCRKITTRVQYAGSNEVTSRTSYDGNDWVTSVHDAGGNATSFAYDALGRCTSKTFADSGAQSYTYDLNSNIVTKVDQNGTATFMAYDRLNRLTQRTFDLAVDVYGESTAEQFTYDALGRLSSASDSDSLVIATYNTAGLIESEEQRVGVDNLTSTGRIVSWTYDDQGRVSALTYPGASATEGRINYNFDPLNRITKATRQLTSTTVQDIATWTFKGRRVIRRDNGNGTWLEVGYDSKKLVSTVHHKRGTSDYIFKAGYGYDAAGIQTSESLEFFDDNGDPVEDKGFVFRYDLAGRLTTVYRGVPASDVGSAPPTSYSRSIGYQLDANGNRTTVASTPYGGSATYDVYTTNNTNAYTQVSFGGSVESFTYDLAGNRITSEGFRHWHFDYANRLVEALMDDTLIAAYHHDALGRRTEKRYNYDGLSYPECKRFVYAGEFLVQEWDVTDVDGEETTGLEIEYFWGSTPGEPVYLRAYDLGNDSAFDSDAFYHQSRSGSVYCLTGNSGGSGMVESYRYTEYGEVEAVYAADTTTPTSAASGNKWFHQCHYYDAEITYLVNGQALYGGDRPFGYDPEQGAPISRIGDGPPRGGCPDPNDASVRNDPDWFGFGPNFGSSVFWWPTPPRKGVPPWSPLLCGVGGDDSQAVTGTKSEAQGSLSGGCGPGGVRHSGKTRRYATPKPTSPLIPDAVDGETNSAGGEDGLWDRIIAALKAANRRGCEIRDELCNNPIINWGTQDPRIGYMNLFIGGVICGPAIASECWGAAVSAFYVAASYADGAGMLIIAIAKDYLDDLSGQWSGCTSFVIPEGMHVIGHYSDQVINYIQRAELTGDLLRTEVKTFNLPAGVYDDLLKSIGGMDAVRSLNKASLDKGMEEGATFLLGSPSPGRVGSDFEWELAYMASKGYELVSSDFSPYGQMIPRAIAELPFSKTLQSMMPAPVRMK